MSALQLVHVAGAAMAVGSIAFGLIACSVWTDHAGYPNAMRRGLIVAGFLIVGALICGLGVALLTVA